MRNSAFWGRKRRFLRVGEAFREWLLAAVWAKMGRFCLLERRKEKPRKPAHCAKEAIWASQRASFARRFGLFGSAKRPLLAGGKGSSLARKIFRCSQIVGSQRDGETAFYGSFRPCSLPNATPREGRQIAPWATLWLASLFRMLKEWRGWKSADPKSGPVGAKKRASHLLYSIEIHKFANLTISMQNTISKEKNHSKQL